MATNTQVDIKSLNTSLEWVNTLIGFYNLYIHVYPFFPGPEYQWPNGLKENTRMAFRVTLKSNMSLFTLY